MAGSSWPRARTSWRAGPPKTSSSESRRCSGAATTILSRTCGPSTPSTAPACARWCADTGTAQRLRGAFRLANAGPRVRDVLALARLDGVLEVFDTLGRRLVALAAVADGGPDCRGRPGHGGAARAGAGSTGRSPGPRRPPIRWAARPARPTRRVASGAPTSNCSNWWPRRSSASSSPPSTRAAARSRDAPIDGAGADAALRVGRDDDDHHRRLAGTRVRHRRRGGIIRFRTPVEDPKDVTVLFLLMGLGMACGMGAFASRGSAPCSSAWPCSCSTAPCRQARIMMVEITATGRDFPLAHVVRVFAQHGVPAEPRQVSQGDEGVTVSSPRFPWGLARGRQPRGSRTRDARREVGGVGSPKKSG